METQWNGHTLKVTGDWTSKWLFLAPQYELWLDDERLDLTGGPKLHPKLEAVYTSSEGEDGEEEDENQHHIEAEILSIAGIRPRCDLYIDDELVLSNKINVQNVLNPILLIIIIGSIGLMLYVGPEVLSRYL